MENLIIKMSHCSKVFFSSKQVLSFYKRIVKMKPDEFLSNTSRGKSLCLEVEIESISIILSRSYSDHRLRWGELILKFA